MMWSMAKPVYRCEICNGEGMRILILALVTGLVSLVSNLGWTQEAGPYGGVGLTTYEFDTVGANAVLGYDFNSNFALETEGVLGLSGTTTHFDGHNIRFKIKNTVGGFVVARLPVNDQISLFARGGYHQTKVKLADPGVLLDNTTDGVAAGVGIQYSFSGRNAIRLGYTFYAGDLGDLNTASLHFIRKF